MPSATNLRSPSPAPPGAWPHTPLRSRSVTSPNPISALDAMHLNIVHVQTNLAQPSSFSSDETLAQSTTTGSMPSEGSQLTKFTQTLSGNSMMSAMTDASLDTSTSTLEERALLTSGNHKMTSSSSEARIHQLPSPEPTPDSQIAYTRRAKVNHSQQQIIVEDEPTGDTSTVSQSSARSSVQSTPSNFTPSTSSASGSPLSPMIFVSPTASNRTPPAIRRIRAANQSYSFSSDEDGEYDESGLLRLGSPSFPASLSSSPRSSPFSSPNRVWRQDASVVIVSPISETYNSSTEGLQEISGPHLTSLSLPGSVNLDDIIPDASPFLSRGTQHDVDWTLSLTGTSEHDFSPLTASVTSPVSVVAQSISPSSSLRARLENPLGTHLLNFPSPAISTSPAASPVEDTHALETNAAEYATAVMMSSWGSTGLQIEPIGLQLTRGTNALAHNEPEDSLVRAPIQRQTMIISDVSRRKRGVLSKVKRFGVKVKHIFFQAKSKERQEVEVSPNKKNTNSHLPKQSHRTIVTDNPTTLVQSMAIQATPPTLELELGTFDLEEQTSIPPVSSSGLPVSCYFTTYASFPSVDALLRLVFESFDLA
ncbi:hypothetical protein J3R30DRAFT_1470894 [Lentinula aciculospora]|uniref:Uncharacterized protein n=1 Tax=Lentinula aciculospora TaxID=153920 RepID=A0A9W9AMN2_9AGAR|nr:hypothetical protein J3R30DRAFT_1470894 [Lentinula aciculospora]